MTEDIELKPCPFCGNKFPLIRHAYYTDTWYIACPNCQTDFSLDGTAGKDRSKEKTIEGWNRRQE